MNKRKITTRVIFDGVVDKTYTQMRQVYTDDQGEYVNCDAVNIASRMTVLTLCIPVAQLLHFPNWLKRSRRAKELTSEHQ